MKRTMLIGQVILLAVMSLTSSNASESLECYSDFIDTITCVWNSSSVDKRVRMTPGTDCFLQGELFYMNDSERAQSDLVPLEDLNNNKLYEGTLRFSKKPEALPKGEVDVPVSVQCANQSMAIIKDFDPQMNIKLSPPERLQVNGANVSWTLAPGQPKLVQGQCSFQLQFRLLEEKWEDSDIVSLPEESCLLPEEKLFSGRQYVVRVRSIFKYSNHWSNWSPTTTWTSTVGSRPDPTQSYTLIPGFPYLSRTAWVVVLITVVVLLSCIKPIVRFLKNRYIRKPSEYFGTLGSVHGWDFKSWLGPFVSPELYVKADSEVISPVEVHDYLSSDTPYSKEGSGGRKDKLESNASSFSNSMYFLSQSSKCKSVKQLELGSPQSAGGPEEDSSTEEKVLLVTGVPCINDMDNESGLSSPLETSSTYKHLQKLRLDVQSPDSGFVPGSEDQESQEESGSEDLPSPPVVDHTLTIRHMLPCPVPKESSLATVPIPLLIPPGNTKPFEMPPLCIITNTLMADINLMACSGMVEPSSGDYMPVKKVQEQ